MVPPSGSPTPALPPALLCPKSADPLSALLSRFPCTLPLPWRVRSIPPPPPPNRLPSYHVVPQLRNCAKVIVFDGPGPQLSPDRRARYAELKQTIGRLVTSHPLFQGTTIVELREAGTGRGECSGDRGTDVEGLRRRWQSGVTLTLLSNDRSAGGGGGGGDLDSPLWTGQ